MGSVRRGTGAWVLVAGLGWLVHAQVAGAQQSPSLFQGSLIIHYFGNDSTTGMQKIFTARPLGAFCNPAISGGKTCDATQTLQVGAPLTGGGTASLLGASPVGIGLPGGALVRTTSGSLPLRYPAQTYIKTYANLANAIGYFWAGGGPGAYVRTFSPPVAYAHTRVAITPGKNQFGGAMRLLAKIPSSGLGWRFRGELTYGSVYTGIYPTLGATLVGGTISSLGAALPVSDTVTGTSCFFGCFPRSAFVIGWPWTTGTVSVEAYGDAVSANPFNFSEKFRRSGYDNRTPKGAGTIQLVSPHFTLWKDSSLKQAEIAVLRLKFVPEPSRLLLLLSGLGTLFVLHRTMTRWSLGEQRPPKD